MGKLCVFGAVLIAVCMPVVAYAHDPIPEGVSAICIEPDTGHVLFEENADIVRPPASMIKLIMMLLVSEGIDAGDWTLEQPITASAKAERMGGTQVYLSEGEVWSLGKLMEAIAVSSANDAAMAVAEGLWGSEEAYRTRMNERAAELGMTNTKFVSVHGLPPDKGEDPDATTARDMAILAAECVASERIMTWVGTKEYVFREGAQPFYNTNKLLWRMEGCDGLKTGYIRAAGFCVSATAQHNGKRLVSVVMGHPSKYGRFNLAQQLMEEAFLTADTVVADD